MQMPEMPVAAAVAASALGPVALAAGQAPMPPGIPWWAALLASVVGPGCSAVLWFVSKNAVRAMAASIRAKGTERKRLALIALADKDPANDAPARDEALRAAGELAIAASLETAVGSLDGDITEPGFRRPKSDG